LLREGSLRRFVYRSIDLRSRYNELTQEQVDTCFAEAAVSGQPRVLSFFSHDNRDMRPETYHVVELLRNAAARTGVRWASCTAVEAHRRYHGLEGQPLELELIQCDGDYRICASAVPFQRLPFVAAELHDDRFVRLFPKPDGEASWRLAVRPADVRRIAAAVTSLAGDVALSAPG
jgi:hypothetical protein